MEKSRNTPSLSVFLYFSLPQGRGYAMVLEMKKKKKTTIKEAEDICMIGMTVMAAQNA